AGTGVRLDLIKPLGFSADDKMLKRGGLDYWEHVDSHYHEGLDELCAADHSSKDHYITKFIPKTDTNLDCSDTEGE
ncbi:tRNA (uridine(34)/cytosine(34)/5-carboxymethylaminomethyluridine(34)-2'-O)-methyltransferase TrmL, partial [Planococcus sp. SIMBA_160]